MNDSYVEKDNLVTDIMNGFDNKISIEFEKVNIEDLDISNRLKHVLIEYGIKTYNDLLNCPNDLLEHFKNAGKKTIDEAIYLKNHPSMLYLIFNKKDEIESNLFNKVIELEKNMNINFVETVYSELTFKDLEMSIRLKNCLYKNKIITVPDFLKTPVIEIQKYQSLGNKCFDEVLEIKNRLLDINNYKDSSELLYLFIRKITADEPKSIIYIKNYMSENTNYNLDNFLDDLNKLKNDNRIELSMNGIKIKKTSVIDYINTIEDEKKRNIMNMRLNGCTLEEIGNKEGVTRERIRQISAKILNNLPDVHESKYKYIYEKYNFNENEFCELFNESKETYNFLKLAYENGVIDIKNGLNTNDFNEYQKCIIKKLKNIITLFGKTINCNKNDIIEVLIEEYATDGILFEDFTRIYNNFSKNNLKYDLGIIDVRSMEGLLNRLKNTIFDFGRKFRFFNYSKIDKKTLENLHKVIDLGEGYYSTLVLFREYSDLMKEIDIRNEYELHSFFKKNNALFPELRMDRMPNFSIGNIEKHDFVLSKINEIAPISINDFLEFMENNYGYKSNTFLTYITSEFSEYINGNYIDSDVIEINESLILELKELLTKPIYSLDEVKAILVKHEYSNIDDIVTKNNMYKIGYKIRSSYILRKDYDSVEEYYTQLAKTKDFISNENIITSSTYSASIKRVEKNYDIILISDKEFITYKKLSELGINKEIISKFCVDVYSIFKNISYFTVYNIKSMVDTSWIEDNGFDDIFYECLVETIDNIKYLRINNQKIYSFIDDNVEVEDIINEFMVEESIYVDELIDDIKEKYGIDVSSDKLIYSDKFYSRELNKLYLNKECYYKEVYNYE